MMKVIEWLLEPDPPDVLAMTKIIAAVDFVTFVSYLSIGIVFVTIIRSRHAKSFRTIMSFLGVMFILGGLTDMASFLMSYWPVHRAEVFIKSVNAFVSLSATVLLLSFIPRILHYQTDHKKYVESRTIDVKELDEATRSLDRLVC